MLEDIGAKLTEIDLYAVDQLDMKTIAMISIYCKKLGISTDRNLSLVHNIVWNSYFSKNCIQTVWF